MATDRRILRIDKQAEAQQRIATAVSSGAIVAAEGNLLWCRDTLTLHYIGTLVGGTYPLTPVNDPAAAEAVQRAEAATLDALDATSQALIAAGLDPQYISLTTTWPPLGPEGTYGSRRDILGGVITGQVVGGQWKKVYGPTLTEASMATVIQTAWVSPTGSDTRGYVGRDYQPFRTLDAALAALGDETSAIIRLDNGLYAAPAVESWRSRLAVIGSGMGFYAPDSNSIVGPGSIIQGGVKIYRPDYITLRDLGVDAGAAARAAVGQDDGPHGPGRDALWITNWDNTGNPQPQLNAVHLWGIRALGESVGAQYHCILVEGVTTGTLENLWTLKNTHGVVAKMQEGRIGNIEAHGHAANAVIVRHSNPYGIAKKLLIYNIFMKAFANPGDTGGLNLVANGPGETLTNFTVMNVVGFQTTFAVNLDASNGGTIADGVIMGVHGDGNAYNSVSTQGGAERITFSGLRLTASKGNAVYLGAGGRELTLFGVTTTVSAGAGLRNEAIGTRLIGCAFASGNPDLTSTQPLTADAMTTYGTATGTAPTVPGASSGAATVNPATGSWIAYADTFDRANGPLGDGWTTRTGSPRIVGGVATTGESGVAHEASVGGRFTDGLLTATLTRGAVLILWDAGGVTNTALAGDTSKTLALVRQPNGDLKLYRNGTEVGSAGTDGGSTAPQTYSLDVRGPDGVVVVLNALGNNIGAVMIQTSGAGYRAGFGVNNDSGVSGAVDNLTLRIRGELEYVVGVDGPVFLSGFSHAGGSNAPARLLRREQRVEGAGLVGSGAPGALLSLPVGLRPLLEERAPLAGRQAGAWTNGQWAISSFGALYTDMPSNANFEFLTLTGAVWRV